MPAKILLFFLNYISGKCTQQRFGINKFGALGKTIAIYLNLPHPNLYTGHCFRRTSATLLVDSGGDIITLKRHGGWKSTAVAESYVDDSMTNKILVSNSILHTIENNKSEININMQPTPSTSTSTSNNNASCPSTVQIQFHNCNIQNMHNYYNK